MIVEKRIIRVSLVFSLAIATYVTIKTAIIIYNFIKYRRSKDILLKELKTIELIDVIVSILTLQNTLITVNGQYSYNLLIMTVISSLVGVLVNLFLLYKLRLRKSTNSI